MILHQILNLVEVVANRETFFQILFSCPYRVTVYTEQRERYICAPSYHDPCEQTDAATAVGVGHHVPVANGQEGHRDHPQGLHVVAAEVPVVVVPVGGRWASDEGV